MSTVPNTDDDLNRRTSDEESATVKSSARIVKRILARDEKLIVHVHPHRKTLVLPLINFFSILAVASIGIGFIWTNPAIPQKVTNWLLGIIVLIAAIILCYTCMIPWLRWVTTHVIATDSRIIYRHGIFTKKNTIVPYIELSKVRYQQGLSERVLGMGTLVMDLVSEECITINKVPRIKSLFHCLYCAITHFINHS